MSRSRRNVLPASPLPFIRPRVRRSAWGRSVWEAPRFSSKRHQRSNFSPACEKISGWIWFMSLLPSLASRSFVLPDTLSGISCGYRAVKLACATYGKGAYFHFPHTTEVITAMDEDTRMSWTCGDMLSTQNPSLDACGKTYGPFLFLETHLSRCCLIGCHLCPRSNVVLPIPFSMRALEARVNSDGAFCVSSAFVTTDFCPYTENL